MRTSRPQEPPLLPKDRPDHHDADLVLRVYEMRREPVMREARARMIAEFWPRSLDDVLAVAKGDHPLNAPFRQIGSYWEMVYGMVRHGIVHADYFLESNGEGLFVFARVAPFLVGYRTAMGSPLAFRNAEWVARETELGRLIYERFEKRIAATLATR